VAGGEHPRFPGYLDNVRQTYRDHPAISWLGFVPESKLREVFSRATIVVLPYTASTGSSSVLYRAAAWGRPVVVSDLPELRATSQEEGLLVEFFSHNDMSSLTGSLQRLLFNPSLRTAQAHHNHHIISSRLTLSDTCQAYQRAFDLALTMPYTY